MIPKGWSGSPSHRRICFQVTNLSVQEEASLSRRECTGQMGDLTRQPCFERALFCKWIVYHKYSPIVCAWCRGKGPHRRGRLTLRLTNRATYNANTYYLTVLVWL